MTLVGRSFPGWQNSKTFPAVGGLRGYIRGWHPCKAVVDTFIIGTKERQVLDMRFVFKMIVFPFWLLTAFLALMLKWTLNLSAFVLALPMLYIFGCGLYTLYCREWLQFLILLVAEFGCFVLIFMGALVADAAERFSGWVAGL